MTAVELQGSMKGHNTVFAATTALQKKQRRQGLQSSEWLARYILHNVSASRVSSGKGFAYGRRTQIQDQGEVEKDFQGGERLGDEHS
jgi:hypothetical protein